MPSYAVLLAGGGSWHSTVYRVQDGIHPYTTYTGYTAYRAPSSRPWDPVDHHRLSGYLLRWSDGSSHSTSYALSMAWHPVEHGEACDGPPHMV